jgi:phosphoglucomutase
MGQSQRLKRISYLLSDRYGERGQEAANRLTSWINGSVPLSYPEFLERHLDEDQLGLVFDAFYQVLPFGTGGRRGRVGYGSNRLNPTTVAMTVQGHCDYLRSFFPDRPLFVVVANDVRVFNDFAESYRFLGESHPLLGLNSRMLARLACEIYAGNNITAYIWRPGDPAAFLSTPELSFLIDRLEAAGGVNLSASHNPPDDNGIKLYDEFGSQPIPPNDQRLADIMGSVESIRQIPFAEALDQGLIREIPRELHGDYIQGYVRLYNGVFHPSEDLTIVYTPLCGCGLGSVGDLLKELGFPIRVPLDQGPDGRFSAIPFRVPNPEVAQATIPATTFADSQNSGIVLSSDPDADRVGLEVKLADGSWYHFDGNKIASVLAYFLMVDARGPLRKGLLVETMVTTRMLGGIVAKAGGSWLIDDLLIGFKYMAEVLKALKREGRYGQIQCTPENLVLATEEAHGVMLIPTIRDKDAAPACMYLAALYQLLAREGRTLLDYYVKILDEVGPYADVGRSIVMKGAEGAANIGRLMSSLRSDPPQQIGDYRVNRIVDRWDKKRFGPFKSETDKWSRNVLQYFSDGVIVAVRPSGTEPKLKFYCQLVPYGNRPPVTGMLLLESATTEAEAIAWAMYNDLLSRVDLHLSAAGLLLPDIVEVNRKLAFERETLPKLRRKLSNGDFADIDSFLLWLRNETQAMTPGADPLPALKASIASECGTLADEMKPSSIVTAVRAWAQG